MKSPVGLVYEALSLVPYRLSSKVMTWKFVRGESPAQTANHTGMALQFWKPGTLGPGSSLDRASETEGHVIPSLPSGGQQYGIQDQRERLPIFKHSGSTRAPLRTSFSNVLMDAF